MNIKQGILSAIDQALAERNISDRMASLRATGKPDTIRNIRRGSFPRMETLVMICEALDIELSVSARAASEFGAFSVLEAGAAKSYSRDPMVRIEPLSPGLGGDSPANLDSANASMAFARSWLLRLGMSADGLRITSMYDDSMAPQLMRGDVLLVDCKSTKPRANALVVVDIQGCRLVRRMIKVDNSDSQSWMLVSEEGKNRAMLLNVDDQIVGKIVWRGGQCR